MNVDLPPVHLQFEFLFVELINLNIAIILKHFIGDNKSNPPNLVPLIGCKN